MWGSKARKLWSPAATAFLYRELNHFKTQCSSVSPPPPCSLSLLTSLGRSRKLHCNFLSSHSRAPGTWSFYSSSSSLDGGGAAIRCWNCGAVASSEPFLACRSCRSVQPVNPSVDYFQIFGLERGFEIRIDNLESMYKDWQKKLHPDLVHQKSERERAYAAEQSARVIDAYRTLSRPLSRASYLLQIEGIHVDEEKTVSDPELLAEVMEIREAVEEANDSRALEQMKSQIQKKLENWSNAFWEAFKNHEFEDAVTSVRRMTYYERAIQEIVKKL